MHTCIYIDPEDVLTMSTIIFANHIPNDRGQNFPVPSCYSGLIRLPTFSQICGYVGRLDKSGKGTENTFIF